MIMMMIMCGKLKDGGDPTKNPCWLHDTLRINTFSLTKLPAVGVNSTSALTGVTGAVIPLNDMQWVTCKAGPWGQDVPSLQV